MEKEEMKEVVKLFIFNFLFLIENTANVESSDPHRLSDGNKMYYIRVKVGYSNFINKKLIP